MPLPYKEPLQKIIICLYLALDKVDCSQQIKNIIVDKGVLIMAQITWNDSFSVHNAVIDVQHQEWIAIYNRLDHVLLHGSNSDLAHAASETLQAMQDYANYHFRQEERYLQEIHYPDLVAHRRLHKDFDDQVYSYYKKILSGEWVLNTEVISILKNWLEHHILHEDQKYCAFASHSQN